jgi:hypothetical protein
MLFLDRMLLEAIHRRYPTNEEPHFHIELDEYEYNHVSPKFMYIAWMDYHLVQSELLMSILQ